MKRRNFFARLLATLLVPWNSVCAWARPKKLIEVFPKSLEELPGLIVTDYLGESHHVILREAGNNFLYLGQQCDNWRKNKFWGRKIGDPTEEEVLICIDSMDLKWKFRPRFFKPRI